MAPIGEVDQPAANSRMSAGLFKNTSLNRRDKETRHGFVILAYHGYCNLLIKMQQGGLLYARDFLNKDLKIQDRRFIRGYTNRKK